MGEVAYKLKHWQLIVGIVFSFCVGYFAMGVV